MYNRRQKGAEWEERTAAALKRSGYVIVERNFRCRSGEIDLIARHRGYLVFIEVKYRRNADYGYAAEAVDFEKQKRICRVADHYVRTRCKEIPPCRFDVAAWDGERLTIYENAFEYISGGKR